MGSRQEMRGKLCFFSRCMDTNEQLQRKTNVLGVFLFLSVINDFYVWIKRPLEKGFRIEKRRSSEFHCELLFSTHDIQ